MNNIFYFCCLLDFSDNKLDHNVSNNTYVQNFLNKKLKKNIAFELKLVKNNDKYVVTEILYQKIGLLFEINKDTQIEMHDDTINPNIGLYKPNSWIDFYHEYLLSYGCHTLLLPYEEYEKHIKIYNLINTDNIYKLLDYLENFYDIKIDEIDNAINK